MGFKWVPPPQTRPPPPAKGGSRPTPGGHQDPPKRSIFGVLHRECWAFCGNFLGGNSFWPGALCRAEFRLTSPRHCTGGGVEVSPPAGREGIRPPRPKIKSRTPHTLSTWHATRTHAPSATQDRQPNLHHPQTRVACASRVQSMGQWGPGAAGLPPGAGGGGHELHRVPRGGAGGEGGRLGNGGASRPGRPPHHTCRWRPPRQAAAPAVHPCQGAGSPLVQEPQISEIIMEEFFSLCSKWKFWSVLVTFLVMHS